MFCCTLLYVHSSVAIILIGKSELVALLGVSSWCLVIVVWLFLAVPWVCLRFVIVVFPDYIYLLFLRPFYFYAIDTTRNGIQCSFSVKLPKINYRSHVRQI